MTRLCCSLPTLEDTLSDADQVAQFRLRVVLCRDGIRTRRESLKTFQCSFYWVSMFMFVVVV